MVRRSLWAMLLFGAPACVPLLPEVQEPCATWREPGLYRFEVETRDVGTRKPWVYVPASAGPRDLVVMLHGGGQSGRIAEENTLFLDGADAEGFVAVFPDGLGWPLRTWDVGGVEATGKERDDVAFLDLLVRSLGPKVCAADTLATGFSNGAMMAHRWACEGEEVDAAAPVSGPLMSNPARCVGRPIPIRHYHGTNDTVVPPEGGLGAGPRAVDYRSVDETMEVWRARNACTDEPPVETRDGDTVCTAWSCAVSTELCLIEGWDHRWPGGVWTDATDANATSSIHQWFVAQTSIDTTPAPDP